MIFNLWLATALSHFSAAFGAEVGTGLYSGFAFRALLFLQALPGKLTTEDCAWLNDNFKLNEQGKTITRLRARVKCLEDRVGALEDAN